MYSVLEFDTGILEYIFCNLSHKNIDKSTDKFPASRLL